MEYVSKKVAEYEAYLPPLTRRDDFEAFWRGTIEEAKAVPLNPRRQRIDYPTRFVDVYDISYNGFDTTRIHGWLLIPRFGEEKKLPCVIVYHGFGSSRETPAAHMHWAMTGAAVLAVDCRDQGGVTGNHARYSNGTVTNINAKGILHPEEYYYRAVYMDSLKAIDFAESQEEIDADRIVIRGTSQGGAIGMAVCALDHRPALGMVNVPSNSNIEARVEGRYGSFASVNDYLRRFPHQVDRAYHTLSYFDTMNMAEWITCPVFASVALADPVCPAKLYYASYNRIRSPKEIAVYPFNEHDGARHVHVERELEELRRKLQ